MDEVGVKGVGAGDCVDVDGADDAAGGVSFPFSRNTGDDLDGDDMDTDRRGDVRFWGYRIRVV